jgi:hypothetical protein
MGATERSIGFLVDDLAAAVQELLAVGAEVDEEVSGNARERYVHFRDAGRAAVRAGGATVQRRGPVMVAAQPAVTYRDLRRRAPSLSRVAPPPGAARDRAHSRLAQAADDPWPTHRR